MFLLQQNKFVFWYTRRTPGVRTQSSYEDNIKQIMDFSTVTIHYFLGISLTHCYSLDAMFVGMLVYLYGLYQLQVEGFWVCYCHLARPSSLPSPTDLHLFKQGIRPLWEVQRISNFYFFIV